MTKPKEGVGTESHGDAKTKAQTEVKSVPEKQKQQKQQQQRNKKKGNSRFLPVLFYFLIIIKNFLVNNLRPL